MDFTFQKKTYPFDFIFLQTFKNVKIILGPGHTKTSAGTDLAHRL